MWWKKYVASYVIATVVVLGIALSLSPLCQQTSQPLRLKVKTWNVAEHCIHRASVTGIICEK
jgi:hypothetical protein